MIPNELTHQIGELWESGAAASVAEPFADIVEMSDTLTDVIDRIIEAGWHDDDFEVDPETMEAMSAIAIEGDEVDGPGESDAAVALSGKWQKVGGSSVYVDNGRITKGCPGLKGEMVNDLIDEDEDSREEREARQQHAEAAGIKGHEVTATQARSLGKTRKVGALRAAKIAAKKYNVSTKDILRVMPEAHKHLIEQLDQREKARMEARKKTGLNSHKINQLKDSGRDYTNIAHWDEVADSMAEENPELGWTTGKDSNDTSQKLWDLIKEPRDVRPNQNSPEVAEVAAQMIASAKRSGLKRKPAPDDDGDFASDWGDWDEGQEAQFNPDDDSELGDAAEPADDDAGGFDPSAFDKPNPRQQVVSHVSKQLKTIRAAAAELQHFKNVASANGVDAEKVIKSLGGIPFSIRLSQPVPSALVRTSIADAARATDRNPTKAQREAGNYRKGRFKLWGWEIVIENPRGSVRSGIGSDGKPWATRMPNHYGYIRQTESEADGDHIDVFIGPDIDSDLVYVVDQQNKDGDFDEHKCMVGFSNAEDAKQGYLDAYSADWDGFCGLTEMAVAEFCDWIEHGDTSGPLYQAGAPVMAVATNGD